MKTDKFELTLECEGHKPQKVGGLEDILTRMSGSIKKVLHNA